MTADEGFVGDPMLDGLDTLLTVDVRSGRVHRGLCDRLPAVGYGAKWSHAVSGEQDRACALCLPGGLPE